MHLDVIFKTQDTERKKQAGNIIWTTLNLRTYVFNELNGIKRYSYKGEKASHRLDKDV